MNQQNKLPIYKITIVGAPGAGKTSLLQRQLTDTFNQMRKATIVCDFYHKIYNLGFIRVKAQFWDTAGQQRFRTLPPIFYKSPKVVLLCFSLSDRKSFDNLDYWMSQFCKYKVPNQNAFLVGCKSDLNPQVSDDQIRQFCELKNIQYFKTSSLTGEGVYQAFRNALISSAKRQLAISSQNQQNLKLQTSNNAARRKTCC